MTLGELEGRLSEPTPGVVSAPDSLAAKALLTEERFRSAVSRAYYAMVVLFVKTVWGRFLRNFSPRFGDSLGSLWRTLPRPFSRLGVVDLSRRSVTQRLMRTALIVEG